MRATKSSMSKKIYDATEPHVKKTLYTYDKNLFVATASYINNVGSKMAWD